MNKHLAFLIAAIIFLSNTYLKSQSSGLYIPRNIQKAYEQKTRSRDGNPGSRYWQNRADYTIDVEFDPVSLLISGKETIEYFNNSPDTLQELVLHLFQNLFKKGNSHIFDIDNRDQSEGVILENITINNKSLDLSSQSESVVYKHTSMIIKFPSPQHPNTSSMLSITWHYPLNEGSHIRTGAIDQTSFFVAYFFPRLAVYDDIDGWNDFAYTGSAEFYNDFGNFEVSVSVPKNFVVWATGIWQNPAEVLTKIYHQRYQKALLSDSIVHIIDSTDYRQPVITARRAKNVWKFKGENISDFAFATSDHYLWDGSSMVVDSTSGRRVFMDVAYHKNSKDYYNMASISRKAVAFMSQDIPGIPFPYPKITIVNSLDEMEYPMMVNLLSYKDHHATLRVGSHEIFHSYFPFYMGINETKYGWMDEGLTTFGTYLITESIDSPCYSRLSFYEDYMNNVGDVIDVPIFTASDHIMRPVYYFTSYTKPAAFFLMLKNLLGDHQFKRALQEFMNRWNGRHPTPYDLFYTFEEVTGENLDWIIRPWIFEFGYVDLAVKEVILKDSQYEIIIEKKGRYPAPIKLKITYGDGEVETVHKTAVVWKGENSFYTIEMSNSKKIRSIELLNKINLDADVSNNSLTFD